MSDITDEQLAAWQKLCDEATPGPWTHSCWGTLEAWHNWESGMPRELYRTEETHDDPTIGLISRNDDGGYNDAEFIAVARMAMPALIAEVKRLREFLDELRQDALERDDD